MPRTQVMTDLEAAELAKFRDNIQNADVTDVLTTSASVIEEAHDLLRQLGAPEAQLAQLVTVACELRLRRRWLEQPSFALRAGKVGHG